MDIGKLYETLTGEPCPHAPKAVVEAAWALSKDGGRGATASLNDDPGAALRAPARSETAPSA
jgi:hypothetical protein